MALPRFDELSPTVQIVVILVVGAVVWGGAEFVYLRPLAGSNAVKQKQADSLNQELAPLRQYVEKQKILVAENQQLEIQLANLRQIVPDEKEVDRFIRMVEAASVEAGIHVRRFTSKPVIRQDYYVEVPFEMELDGPYYQVREFYDKVSRMARIVNVSDVKMGGLKGGKSVGKGYQYGSNETVAAVCTIITYFSTEGEAPKPGPPGAKVPPRK